MAGKITDSTIPVPNNPSLWADGYSQGNDNIDYYDYFFKDNVFAHEHNISVTGGTDKIQYYLSANYLGQDGELRIGDEYSNRYTASAKINAQLSKIVSVGFNTRFIRSDYVQPTHLNEVFLPKSDANVGLPNLSMTQMVFYMTTMCSKCKTEVKNKNETLGSTNN